jgi:hypothetical protein
MLAYYRRGRDKKRGLANALAICYTQPMDHDYDTDPRVLAAAEALWHSFKSDYETVLEASEAVHAMAIIAVRAIDRLQAT